MIKRRKPNQKKSKRYFSATADKTHPKNLQAVPMRGGFRI